MLDGTESIIGAQFCIVRFSPCFSHTQRDNRRLTNWVFVAELHTWPCWRICGATAFAFSITCTGGASAGRTVGSCWVMLSRAPTSVCPGPVPARPPLQTPLSRTSLWLQFRSDPLLLSCLETTVSGSPRSPVYSLGRQTAWAANASCMEVCWQLTLLFFYTPTVHSEIN